QAIGIADSFWHLAAKRPASEGIPNDCVLLNQALCSQLNAKPGDMILLRVPKVSVFSRDAPLTPQSETSIGLRLKIQAAVSDDELGQFSLRAASAAPFSAFVRL